MINAERYEVTNTAGMVMSRAQDSSLTIRMCCDAKVSFSCGCPLHEDITSQVHWISEMWVLYIPNCISSHPKRLYLHPHHSKNPALILDSCLLCFGERDIHGNITDVQRCVCKWCKPSISYSLLKILNYTCNKN